MPIFPRRAVNSQAAKLMRAQRRQITDDRDQEDMETHPWWAQRTMRNLLTVLARKSAGRG
jgi:hypothetical protein